MSKKEKIREIKRALQPSEPKTLTVYRVANGVKSFVKCKPIEADTNISIHRHIVSKPKDVNAE